MERKHNSKNGEVEEVLAGKDYIFAWFYLNIKVLFWSLNFWSLQCLIFCMVLFKKQIFFMQTKDWKRFICSRWSIAPCNVAKSIDKNILKLICPCISNMHRSSKEDKYPEKKRKKGKKKSITYLNIITLGQAI